MIYTSIERAWDGRYIDQGETCPEGGSCVTNWFSVRKGATHLHLSYAHTFTNNLCGYDTQIRAEPGFEIRLDLSPNLRSRNRQSNEYLDARPLADGEIAHLKLLQVDDDRIHEAIARSLHRLPFRPDTWRLTLSLQKDWSFIVAPEVRRVNAFHSLLLDVQSLDAEGAKR